MSSNAVPDSRDTNKRISDNTVDISKAIIDDTKVFEVTSPEIGLATSQASNEGSASGNYLSRSGDTRLGPMGNDFRIIEIISGVIDVSVSSINYVPHLLLNPEGGTPDDLVTIVPGSTVFKNQQLTLQNGTATAITIKTTGNIVTPNNADIVLNFGESVDLYFSILLNGWIVRSVSEGGAGGLSEPIILTLNTITPQTLPTKSTVDWSKNPNVIALDRAVEFEFSNLPTTGKYEGVLVIIDIGATVGFASPIWPSSLTNPPVIPITANSRVSVILYTINGGTLVTHATSVGSSTGGDLSQWATFPAVQDINFATNDGINIDRLRFVSDSAAPASSGDPSIFLDGASNMVFNIADQRQYFWTMDSKTRMQLDQSGVNNDTILTVETDASDASAIPFFNIFRDDPTPQSGLGGDSEITNLQFIGTHAATNGGASAGSNVYSKIVTTYESVITGREASSVNFFTSFDTGAATQLKAFMGINNSNSNEIEAFVDLNLNNNNINTITDIIGRDDATPFRIIFNALGGNDTLIRSDVTDGDRVDFFADAKNVFLFSWNTSSTIGLVGLPFDNTNKLLMTISNHAVQFNTRTVPPDADLINNEGFVFFDTATDPAVLKIKKKDSVGGVTLVSLEQGGGTGANVFLSNLDPTTIVNQPINMNGKFLTLDVDKDTSISAFTDDQIIFTVGGSVRMQLDNTALLVAEELSMQNLNKITNVNNPTSAQDVVTLNYFNANSVTNPLTVALDMGNNDITNVDDIFFNQANTSIEVAADIVTHDYPSGGTWRIRELSTSRVIIDSGFRITSSTNIGVFGNAAVAQQSVASDTLANLYTALRAYGWIA